MWKLIWIPLLLCRIITGYSQVYTLDLTPTDNHIIHQWIRTQPPARDSVNWVLARNSLFRTLHAEGYLLAELKEWKVDSPVIHTAIDPGYQFHWAKFKFRGLEFLPPQWVKGLDLSGQIVNYTKWKTNVNDILLQAQHEGYLFAGYKLEILSLKDDSIFAEIIFNPGKKIILDSIEIQGNARLSDHFLQKIVGLKRGEPVTPEILSNLQLQLSNLRFVVQTTPPVLILVDDKATIRAYLNNRNASAFDILAGLQPSTDLQKKLTLTGYVKLDLVNQLTYGERFYLNLEKLRARSQKLELSLTYPFLLDLPFGMDGDFKLTKNDTLYSEIEWKAGISWPLGKDQLVKAGVTQYSTNIISIDKNRIISTKQLPSYVDLRIKGLTFGLIRNRLDFDLNPRKGYAASLSAGVSQKHVVPNSTIESLSSIDTSFNYSMLYDSLRGNTSRISLEGIMKYFIPWGSRSTILLAADIGGLKSGKKIFDNELFRLGGYARLRGFDEESILAQYFSILTAEYRLIIGGGSYVSLFGDYAWIKNVEVEIPVDDHPFGVGIGLNLETKAGIFGMRAAVGAQRGNSIDIDQTRIHLGYVNRF
jgi:outer membrane protein assembly factor BamA